MKRPLLALATWGCSAKPPSATAIIPLESVAVACLDRGAVLMTAEGQLFEVSETGKFQTLSSPNQNEISAAEYVGKIPNPKEIHWLSVGPDSVVVVVNSTMVRVHDGIVRTDDMHLNWLTYIVKPAEGELLVHGFNGDLLGNGLGEVSASCGDEGCTLFPDKSSDSGATCSIAGETISLRCEVDQTESRIVKIDKSGNRQVVRSRYHPPCDSMECIPSPNRYLTSCYDGAANLYSVYYYKNTSFDRIFYFEF